MPAQGRPPEQHGTVLAYFLGLVGREVHFSSAEGVIAVPFVKCSVDGCNQRLQPVLKVDPRDQDTWLYPECDVCGKPVCDKHSSEVEGQVVCDPCRRDIEARHAQTQLIDLGIRPPSEPRR